MTGPCGDTMEFWLLVRDGRVIKASFVTDGCDSSISCGSMAAALSEGRSIRDAMAISQQEILNRLSGLGPQHEHCALLASTVMRASCDDCLQHMEAAALDHDGPEGNPNQLIHGGISMRIAIPLADGKLAMHFGHCASFALVDVSPAGKEIEGRRDIDSPPHQPGLLPGWLAERGATMIIAGGMGQHAQGLFQQHGIEVLVGAPAETPEKLVEDYLAGRLQAGENVCDH